MTESKQYHEAGAEPAPNRWQPGTPMRYCPHCRHPLDEGWAFDRVRPICTACGFVHFRDPKVGVSVLIEQDGQVLLVQRGVDPGLGKWSLPSGFVEWDEAPETTATRECLEETGLSVEVLGLLEARHYADDFRGPGINLTYRAQVTGGSLKPGDDARRVSWFGPNEIPQPDQLAFRSHRTILARWAGIATGSVDDSRPWPSLTG